MDPVKLFNDLDSSNNLRVEDAKARLVELFNHTKENFMVVGLIDYFAATLSLRVLKVLVKVTPPHDKYIFDKLSEMIRDRDRKSSKLTALEIFGYIVRSGPTWLYKITTHQLLKDILKLLKTERDIVILMSALLSVVTLLPIVPTSVVQYLHELFEVFSHLAAWNEHGQRLSEEQLIHLQIGLFCLFQRLYGMYPNNFTDYIRTTYFTSQNAKTSIFHHTIRPLLETVKIHPLLINGTRETEISQKRWTKMEPHDVVMECARLSLEYVDRSGELECSRYITPIKPEFTAPNFNDVKLFGKMNLVNFGIGDGKEIWSPSNVVFSTPPPTGVLSHTSTPTPNLHFTHISTSDGYSPPETAVEATPETTPMKDSVRAVHTVPASSTIARAIWNSNTSQPSSPAKNMKFTYPGDAGSSQRLLRMVSDRVAASQIDDAEDQEVRVINSRPVDIKGAITQEKGLDDTLTDFENEGSPCVEGGLHISSSRSVYEFAKQFNRIRMASIGLDEVSYSASTTPDISTVRRLRRCATWPRMNVVTADYRSAVTAPTPPAPTEKLKPTAKLFQQIRKDLSSKTLGAIENKGVQTAPTLYQPYDPMISDLFQKELRLRSEARPTVEVALSPDQLLDELIKVCARRNNNPPDTAYQESLDLLNLQLQYERHRREVHADRNRRLLGITRQIHQYEQNVNTLRDQVGVLTTDNARLNEQLNAARYGFNAKEQALSSELQNWQQKYTVEQEENKHLRAMVESLKQEIVETTKANRENTLELEAARGELFDVKNEMRQLLLQVEISQQYKEELTRVQTELAIMGEIQIKCQEKFTSLEHREEKDAKFERLQGSYLEEINNLRASLESKNGQLETTRARLSELEFQITRRDTTFTELKRDLKKTKEEYDEQIEALRKRYETQKACVSRLEEHILEIHKTPIMKARSPESERTHDLTGSLEYAASPLSLSQASSEGLSASLKSITEMRNLHSIALAEPGSSTMMDFKKSSPADIPRSNSTSSTL